MKIVFSSKNGFCPSYTYGNIKYYIQDRKRNSNDYCYSFYKKNIESETIEFLNNEETSKFLKSKKNIKKTDTYSFGTCYEDRRYRYVVNDNKVKIFEKEIQIAADFDTYEGCLKFSKGYISDLISVQEPQQVMWDI